MKAIVTEIERALGAHMYYLALVNALALPDICAALESPDGKTSPNQYRTWYDTWLGATYPMINSTEMYCLRCGVVHQAILDHPGFGRYNRILFTIPTAGRPRVHSTMLIAGNFAALNLDAEMFCRDILDAVTKWFTAKENDTYVKANLSRLLQFRSNGLAPYISGIPLIA